MVRKRTVLDEIRECNAAARDCRTCVFGEKELGVAAWRCRFEALPLLSVGGPALVWESRFPARCAGWRKRV